jgi:hypothetical protein
MAHNLHFLFRTFIGTPPKEINVQAYTFEYAGPNPQLPLTLAAQAFSHPQGQRTYPNLDTPSLSLRALYERLSLLAQLQLPCGLFLAGPSWLLASITVKTIAFNGQELNLAGDNFSLRLQRDSIGHIRLVNRREQGENITMLEIQQPNGVLYARIQPASDNAGNAAVWRDVMDNPLLSMEQAP